MLKANFCITGTKKNYRSFPRFSERKAQLEVCPPSAPWTFCINNWQYPEVSGAVWGHTMSCGAPSCTLSPHSWHPCALVMVVMAHPQLPQPVLLTSCAATSMGAFLCPLRSYCIHLASRFYSCPLLCKLWALTPPLLPFWSCRRLTPESSFSRSLQFVTMVKVSFSTWVKSNWP